MANSTANDASGCWSRLLESKGLAGLRLAVRGFSVLQRTTLLKTDPLPPSLFCLAFSAQRFSCNLPRPRGLSL
jgi:hypothetical protein